MKTLRVSFSFDDGTREDVRMATLLRQTGAARLPCTFYIPTVRELNDAEVVSLSKGFEIGGHTWTHPHDLKLLDDRALVEEIAGNKTYLEELIGKPVTKFCYPRGRYDERVKEAVRACGYLEARTTKVGYIGVSDDPFETHTTIHAYARHEYDGEPWWDRAIRMFDLAVKTGDYFHLWGHSWEVQEHNQWKELENVLRYIAYQVNGSSSRGARGR